MPSGPSLAAIRKIRQPLRKRGNDLAQTPTCRVQSRCPLACRAPCASPWHASILPTKPVNTSALSAHVSSHESIRLTGMKRTIAVALSVLLATCFATGQQQASQTKYKGKVYEVRDNVKAPKLIPAPQENAPEWIDENLLARVSFVVTPDGSVANIKLLKRTRPDFDDYAVRVASSWRFEPATKGGTPVAVRLEGEVRSHD
jgi:TonB family protein